MTGPKLPGLYDQVTEAEFQSQILDVLRLHGWSCAHFRAAQMQSGRWATPVQADGAGFPDILALHPRAGDALAIELKSERGRTSPRQLQWLAWFEAAQIDSVLWRPSMIDEAIVRIAAPQRRVRAAARETSRKVLDKPGQ